MFGAAVGRTGSVPPGNSVRKKRCLHAFGYENVPVPAPHAWSTSSVAVLDPLRNSA